MSPIFPQELIDLIIDELHGDTPTLKTISLACRPMVASSQAQLFSKIVLRLLRPSSDGLTPCQKLFEILTCAPHLVPLIQGLDIVDDVLSSQMIESAQDISSILLLLHLKRIWIRCRAHWVWQRLPQILQDSLEQTFRSPGLESIQIWGIYLPCSLEYSAFHVFGGAPASLRTLVFAVDGISYTHTRPPPFQWLPKIQSLAIPYLRLDCHGHLGRALSCPALDFSFLRSLSISDIGTPKLWLLLDMIRGRSALQELNVWLNSERHYVYLLAPLSSLRSVRFTLPGDSVENVLTFIRDCATNPRLEHIVLCLGPRHDAMSISDWRAVAVTVTVVRKVVEIHIDGSNGEALQKAQAGTTLIDTKGFLIVKDSQWLSLYNICMQD
ncbi:hypothetical protein C8J57DRAFT_318063 [Mycena rebaudengoi]|nr:hypothetical protein C8J57DRAFT_318063 [Mycena rebaudengoi]